MLYDALLQQYKDPTDPKTLKSLNALCVRLVFCLYAEDAGIFNHRRDMFHDYLRDIPAHGIRKALWSCSAPWTKSPRTGTNTSLTTTPPWAAFPYVNGGLFADEDIEIPPFTEELKSLLSSNASQDFDWSATSPTIFGAVFESTLNPDTRRSGGMHYTSIENIHKVIDPLFLNGLKAELEEIKLHSGGTDPGDTAGRLSGQAGKPDLLRPRLRLRQLPHRELHLPAAAGKPGH